MQEFDNRYGLFDIDRIYTVDQAPTNKLKANGKSILAFIEVIKNGIYLDSTSKRHQVNASISHGRVCGKCGDLNHSEKYCIKTPRCLRCGKNGHDMNNCNATTPTCINCNGNHQCNGELCEKIVKNL